MDNKLTEDSIGHASTIGYGFGHSFDSDYNDFCQAILDLVNANPTVVSRTVRKFIIPKKILYESTTDHISPPSLSSANVWVLSHGQIKDTIAVHRPNYFGSTPMTIEQATNLASSLGFSASVPMTIIKDKSFEISLSGQTGKTWEVRARLEHGYAEKYRVSGTFGNANVHVVSRSVPSPAQPIVEWGSEYTLLKGITFGEEMDLEWVFQYDGREVPNRFTPHVSPNLAPSRTLSHPEPYHFLRTVSKVYLEERNSENEYFRHGKFNPANNGVDQFHSLLYWPNQTATLNPNILLPIQHKSTLGNLIFRIWPYCTGCNLQSSGIHLDSDQDTLRFDLRFVNGEDIAGGSMNRLIGEFSLPYSQLPLGSSTLIASVSDGKGGTSISTFTITVED